jgi:hypothetical protein
MNQDQFNQMANVWWDTVKPTVKAGLKKYMDGRLPKPRTKRVKKDPAFDALWQAYKRPQGKGGSDKCFASYKKKVIDTGYDPDMVMESLLAWQKTEAWKDPKYIPMLSTWLNDGKFKEIPEAKYQGKSNKDAGRRCGCGNYAQSSSSLCAMCETEKKKKELAEEKTEFEKEYDL